MLHATIDCHKTICFLCDKFHFSQILPQGMDSRHSEAKRAAVKTKYKGALKWMFSTKIFLSYVNVYENVCTSNVIATSDLIFYIFVIQNWGQFKGTRILEEKKNAAHLLETDQWIILSVLLTETGTTVLMHLLKTCDQVKLFLTLSIEIRWSSRLCGLQLSLVLAWQSHE